MKKSNFPLWQSRLFWGFVLGGAVIVLFAQGYAFGGWLYAQWH